VSVYEPKGEYQLVCEHLEPHGLGARQLAYDQLKKRLQDEGLFAAERKRALPALPRKVGIVTSLDGAAIHDIINVLRRRHGRLHLVIRPSRVQGEEAGIEIARAIRAIARVPGVEVIIVGRGGGSIEDLWAFNEEIVARAIASSPVPVISAVGHESDYTIADLVADLRAPTRRRTRSSAVSRGSRPGWTRQSMPVCNGCSGVCTRRPAVPRFPAFPRGWRCVDATRSICPTPHGASPRTPWPRGTVVCRVSTDSFRPSTRDAGWAAFARGSSPATRD
jgi:hypothetical protein